MCACVYWCVCVECVLCKLNRRGQWTVPNSIEGDSGPYHTADHVARNGSYHVTCNGSYHVTGWPRSGGTMGRTMSHDKTLQTVPCDTMDRTMSHDKTLQTVPCDTMDRTMSHSETVPRDTTECTMFQVDVSPPPPPPCSR